MDEKYKKIFKMLVPHRAVGYDKVRLGRNHDGGYVMIDDFKDIKMAFGGGIKDDDSWERDVLSRGVPVTAFDVSSPLSMQQIEQLPYQFFLAKMQAFPTKNSTLDLLLSGYNDNEVIAKIDIEFDEWSLLPNTTDKTLSKIRQFALEIHFDDQFNMLLDPGEKFFEKLYKQFRVVHVHGNNWDQRFRKYNNLTMPCVVEMTFANINYYDLIPSEETFPMRLDQPNRPGAPDFDLGTFTF